MHSDPLPNGGICLSVSSLFVSYTRVGAKIAKGQGGKEECMLLPPPALLFLLAKCQMSLVRGISPAAQTRSSPWGYIF